MRTPIRRTARAVRPAIALFAVLVSSSIVSSSIIAHDARRLHLAAVGAFDPLAADAPGAAIDPPAGLAPLSGRTRYALVQFEAAVDAAARDRLADAGARVVGYVPRHALVVGIARERSIAALAELDGVRWAGPFAPEYKVDPELRALLARAPSAPLSTVVELFAGEDPDRFANRLAGALTGVRVEFVERGAAHRPSRLTLRIDAGVERAVALIAHADAVAYVFHHPPPRLDNDDLVWIGQSYDRAFGPHEADSNTIGGEIPSAATIWSRGLFGEGQVVAVADTGLNLDACAWYDAAQPVAPQQVDPPGALALDGAHRKIVALNGVKANTLEHFDTFRHGTHVASTVAGSVAPSFGGGPPGHNVGDGVAPAARIVFEDIGGPLDGNCLSTITVDSVELLLRQEYDAGARISTNSWFVGNAGPGQVDSAVWDLEDFLTVFSAGNTGAAGVNGIAQHKNGVTVGAGENWGDASGSPFGPLDPENLAAFSSLGPAADGRIKPDIVAPGYLVYSNRAPTIYSTDAALCSGDDPTTDVCAPSFGGCYVTFREQTCELVPMLGTSMATPAVAGFAALAREYFIDGFYPSGTPLAADTRSPSAALLKAVLLNGARNMTGRRLERRGTNPLDLGPLADAPSAQQGWGRVMLDDALYFDGDSRRLLVRDVPNASGLVQGQSASIELLVEDSGEPLKLTLVWTDPPAQSYAGTALVNDLDLVLQAPDGTVYRGNRFTPDDPGTPGDKVSTPSPPDSDQLNNVEGILLPGPPPGLYTATIVAAVVPGFESVPTQGYAFVATGGLGAAPDVGSPGRVDTLWVGKAAVDQLTLSWPDGSCSPSASDFAIYEGTIGAFDSHVPLACGTGGQTSITLPPTGSAAYYLVVPLSSEREGSYGVPSGAAERPVSAAACLPQEIAGAICP